MRRHRAAVWPSCAAGLVAALVLCACLSHAQVSSDLLFASPETNPLGLLRLRPPAGEIAGFGYQPGVGTGTTGFDSTNTSKRKTKPKAKPGTAKRAPVALTYASGRAEMPSNGTAPVNQPIGEPPLWSEARETPETEALRRHDAEQIMSLVAALPEPFREAVVMREINDIS